MVVAVVGGEVEGSNTEGLVKETSKVKGSE